jgi:hypothetical protein
MDALDDVTDVPLDLEMPSAVQSARSDRSTDEKIDALVNVVSDLVSRVDSTQRQLDSLQLASAATVSTDQASADLDHYRSQGAIPKRPAECASASCSADHQAATFVVDNQVPSLSQMRCNPNAVRQATHIVDSMDAGPSGTTSINSIKTLRRGWSRQGGDFAPRVVVPWPQDFVLGAGRKNRLTYDDLDMLQWAQGCIAIIEKEEDAATMRSMLATLRSTLRDAQFHGFDAAKFSYGTLLSLMEDGTVSWLDAQAITEERRSALIARGSQSHSRKTATGSNHSRYMNGLGGFRPGGVRPKGNSPNIAGPPGGVTTRPCVYWNNGMCPQKGDHQGVSFFWKHICR